MVRHMPTEDLAASAADMIVDRVGTDGMDLALWRTLSSGVMNSMSPLAFNPPNRDADEPPNYGRARDTWRRAQAGGHDLLWSPSLGPGHVDLHNLSVPLGVGKFQEAFEAAADEGERWCGRRGEEHVEGPVLLHFISVAFSNGRLTHRRPGMPALTVITGSPQGPLRGMKHTVMSCMSEAGGEAWVREDGNAGRFTVEGRGNVKAVKDGLRRLRGE